MSQYTIIAYGQNEHSCDPLIKYIKSYKLH